MGKATVKDNAHVYGNAVVSGCAVVREEAQIFGSAFVGGRAKIEHQSRVYGYAMVLSGAHCFLDVSCPNSEIPEYT
jgi:UDP-3-O-[3-hydroxymyristoyl] glucosamine N-acyltransferase